MKTIAFALAIFAPSIAFAAMPSMPAITLFGVTLDRPLSLPDCAVAAADKMCARAVSENAFEITIPEAQRPAYLSRPVMLAETLDGTVQSLMIMTAGADQQAAFAQLRNTLGQPSFYRPDPAINAEWIVGDQGAAFWGSGIAGTPQGEIRAVTTKFQRLQKTAAP